MLTCGNKTRDVRHIYHEICAYCLCYGRKLLKVDGSGVSARARYYELWLALVSLLVQRFVVDEALVVHAVGYEVEVLARKVYGRAVGEVSACVKAHAHNGIAGLEQCEVNGGVSLSARVRLNVSVLSAENLALTLDSYLFLQRQRIRSRRSSACRGSPQHTCW